MFSALRNFLGFLLWSNIFISLCAASLVLQTLVLFDLEIVLNHIVFIVFFSTLFIYNNHRRIAFKELKSQPTLSLYNHKFYFILSTIALLGLAISLMFTSLQEITLLIPLGFISFFYSVPLTFKNKTFLKLRDLPWIKIFLISFVWSISTVVLPLVDHLEIFPENIAMIFLRRFLFIIAITIPFDIRDLSSDSQNLKTLPAFFGIKKSKIIAVSCLALFLFLCCLEYVFLNNESKIFIAFLISAAITAWLILISNQDKRFYFFYLFLDGMMILQFFLVLFFARYF